jgi:hypothetical protein
LGGGGQNAIGKVTRKWDILSRFHHASYLKVQSSRYEIWTQRVGIAAALQILVWGVRTSAVTEVLRGFPYFLLANADIGRDGFFQSSVHSSYLPPDIRSNII